MQKHKRTYQRLLRHGLELVGSSSFAGVTIGELANRVKLSKSGRRGAAPRLAPLGEAYDARPARRLALFGFVLSTSAVGLMTRALYVPA